MNPGCIFRGAQGACESVHRAQKLTFQCLSLRPPGRSWNAPTVRDVLRRSLWPWGCDHLSHICRDTRYSLPTSSVRWLWHQGPRLQDGGLCNPRASCEAVAGGSWQAVPTSQKSVRSTWLSRICPSPVGDACHRAVPGASSASPRLCSGRTLNCPATLSLTSLWSVGCSRLTACWFHSYFKLSSQGTSYRKEKGRGGGGLVEIRGGQVRSKQSSVAAEGGCPRISASWGK